MMDLLMHIASNVYSRIAQLVTVNTLAMTHSSAVLSVGEHNRRADRGAG